METMLGFAGVVVITMLALFAALALQTALLHLTVRLMQPATAVRCAWQLRTARGWLRARSRCRGSFTESFRHDT